MSQEQKKAKPYPGTTDAREELIKSLEGARDAAKDVLDALDEEIRKNDQLGRSHSGRGYGGLPGSKLRFD